jgi:bifunctional DNA-binding transcriptional regulator/antitoxin component of YhaV-PrlF toxin-antitoxin module
VDVKIKAKEFCDRVSFTAVLDDRGRITIPASARKKLRISFSSVVLAAVTVKADGGEVGFE